MKRKIDYEYHEIIFLVLAVIAMCVAVGFSVYRMDEEYSKPSAKDKASFTFAVLIVFNAGQLLVLQTVSRTIAKHRPECFSLQYILLPLRFFFQPELGSRR